MKLNCGLVRYPILLTINVILVYIFGTTPWFSRFSDISNPAALLSSIKADIYDGDNLQIVRKTNVEAFSTGSFKFQKNN